MNLTHEIHNGMDIIDSRDVIARIEELESDRDAAAEDGETWHEVDAEELADLLAFAEEASGTPDWPHGETLIRESYFQEYAQQLAEDTCPSREVSEAMEQWPYRHIDWEAAADELRYDYFGATFDGVTYLVRH